MLFRRDVTQHRRTVPTNHRCANGGGNMVVTGCNIRRYRAWSDTKLMKSYEAIKPFPFGDITTLMVWQKGLVEFWTFFALFLPSLVNFIVPAFCMSLAISTQIPPTTKEQSPLKRGAWIVLSLFICTIVLAP